MGHNKQSGGFREAPVEPLEGYEAIPTVDELRTKSGKRDRAPAGQAVPAEPTGNSRPGVSAKEKDNPAFDPITGQPLSEALRARISRSGSRARSRRSAASRHRSRLHRSWAGCMTRTSSPRPAMPRRHWSMQPGLPVISTAAPQRSRSSSLSARTASLISGCVIE